MENIKNILLDYNFKGFKDYVITQHHDTLEEVTENGVTVKDEYYYKIYVGKELEIIDNTISGNGYIINVHDNAIVLTHHDNINTYTEEITYSNLDNSYIDIISHDLLSLYSSIAIAIILLVTLIYNWLRSWFGRLI